MAVLESFLRPLERTFRKVKRRCHFVFFCHQLGTLRLEARSIQFRQHIPGFHVGAEVYLNLGYRPAKLKRHR